ncbi:fumarylacetoacetate hydrolase family protein [Kineosporia sp. A_224]|uniref:fumarylacetoacetate hydrolase family protein n=1 Tax=Kineosporia sp. A_224 TaxID=1962180 RepID=UPI0018E9B1EC|nr:fumarylacetoacetate hydrolase family protein [Kineosporia sp. A_224]
MSPWSLVTVRRDGEDFLAVRLADGSLVQPPPLKAWTRMTDLLDDWPAAEPVLRDLDVEAPAAVAGAQVLAPLLYPRKVLCAGVNYRDHIAEMGAQAPDSGWTPFFFLKPPTTTVIGPYDDVPVGDDVRDGLDWEAELAVVIGRGGRGIGVDEAMSHVAGYCVSNDLTARARHRRTNVPAPAFAYDWFASKARDASLPLGPGITPAWMVEDPQTLRVQLWVNDEPQQDGNTRDMICDIPTLISAASAGVTLEPGDVIPTGTPAGVGVTRGLTLKPGDVVRTRIEGLGELSNRIVARTSP